jgi:hypothetical protein
MGEFDLGDCGDDLGEGEFDWRREFLSVLCVELGVCGVEFRRCSDFVMCFVRCRWRDGDWVRDQVLVECAPCVFLRENEGDGCLEWVEGPVLEGVVRVSGCVARGGFLVDDGVVFGICDPGFGVGLVVGDVLRRFGVFRGWCGGV